MLTDLTSLAEVRRFAQIINDLRRRISRLERSGGLAFASYVDADGNEIDLAAGAQRLPKKDAFTVASPTARTYSLSFLPIENSVNLSLNGVELAESDDYTVDVATGDVTLTGTVTTVAGTDPDVLTADYWTDGTAVTAPLILAADTFERADSATVMNPASDGGTWVFDFNSGVADAQWGVLTGGGYMPSTGSNDLGNGSTADRELGTSAQDVTWTLTATDVYDLSSRLRLCSFGDTPGHTGAEKNIALGYTAGAGAVAVGIEDWSGFNALTAGGSVTLAGWAGSTTVIRMVYLPSTHELTIYQDGTLVYTGVLTAGEYAGLGTGAGVRFRRGYALFGERLLDFRAVSSE